MTPFRRFASMIPTSGITAHTRLLAAQQAHSQQWLVPLSHICSCLKSLLTVLLCVVFGLLFTEQIHAATYYYKTGSPNPNLPSSWNTLLSGAGVNATNFTTNGDIFIIPTGRTATLTANLAFGAGTNAVELTVQSGGTLNTATFEVEFAGNGSSFTLSAGATLQTSNGGGFNGVDNVSGAIQITAAMPATVTITYAPTANYVMGSVSAPVQSRNGAAGNKPAITQANNLTVLSLAAGGEWWFGNPLNLSGNFTLQTGGNMTIFSTLTLTGGGSTVQNGANLIINGTGQLANNGGLTIQSGGAFSVYNATNPMIVTGTAISYAAGATLNYDFTPMGGRTTGLELPSTMNGNIYIANTISGPVTLGAPTTLNGVLSVSDVFITSAANMLTVGNTAAGAVVQSGAGEIRGPMRRALPSGASVGTWLFPVSKGGVYMPFAIVNPNTTGGATIQAEAFNVASGGTGDGATLAGALGAYYWLAQQVGGTFNSGLVQVGRTGLAATNAIGSGTTLAGTYASNGINTYNGVPTPPTLTRTVTDNLAVPTYFAVGTALMTVQGNVPPFTPRPPTTPLLNAIDIALGTNVVIPFSQNLNAGTVNATNFRIHAMFTGLKTAGYSQAGATATVNPVVDFKRGEQVWVSVTNAQSTAGTPTRPFVMGFRTRAGAGPAQFPAQTTLAAGTNPYSVATGDFDGDGDMDIVAAVLGTSNIYVYLNTGTGTFAAPTTYTGAMGMYSVGVADLNNDGAPDIVAGNSTGGTYVFLNQNLGTGTFFPGVFYNHGTGVSSYAFGDMDADGDLDMVFTLPNVNSIGIRFNNGAGVFGASVGYFIGASTAPNTVIVADLDGDGDLDVAESNQINPNVSVLMNNGTGTLGAVVNYAAPANPWGLAAGDIDGDGDIDLVSANRTPNSVSVFVNSGTGTFSRTDYPGFSLPQGVTLNDLDGDGDLDIAVSNSGGGGTVRIMLNSGGTFSGGINYAAGAGAYHIAAGDFDGDGDIDLVTPNYGTTTLSVLFNTLPMNVQNNVPPFGVPPVTPVFNTMNAPPATNITIPFSANLNPATVNAANFRVHGSLRGLRTATYGVAPANTATLTGIATSFLPNEQVFVSVTNAQSTGGASTRPFVMGFRASAATVPLAPATFYQTSAPAVGVFPRSVVTGDFDGDGDLDLAVANSGSGNVSILLNTGTGAYSAAVNYSAGTQPISITSGDFDADGDLDLATADLSSNRVSILLNTGAAVYAAAVNYSVGAQPISITTGDFDGDGDLDLATANQSGNNVSILRNTGTGTYVTAFNYGTGTTPVSVTTGDFDGDGDLDLAVTNGGSNNVSILLNTGLGTYNTAINYGVGSGPYSVTSGDFDGDGDLDLATANPGSNNVSILLNTGVGAFSAAVNYGAGANAYSVTSGDFDGDGDLDLAVANYTGTNVSILLNTGTAVFGAAMNYSVGVTPSSVTSGDFDGDGDLDLAVANSNGISGNVSILKNGIQPTLTSITPPRNGNGTVNPNIAAVGAPVTVNFSTNITAATFTVPPAQQLFQVHGGFTGSRTRASGFAPFGSYSGGAATMTFTPSANFRPGELVSVTVTNASSSVAAPNNSVGIRTRPYVFDFRVAVPSGFGTFENVQSPATGTSGFSSCLAHLNADNNLDLAVTNYGSNNITLLQGSVSGTFTPMATITSGGIRPSHITAADFDNDGDID